MNGVTCWSLLGHLAFAPGGVLNKFPRSRRSSSSQAGLPVVTHVAMYAWHLDIYDYNILAQQGCAAVG